MSGLLGGILSLIGELLIGIFPALVKEMKKPTKVKPVGGDKEARDAISDSIRDSLRDP